MSLVSEVSLTPCKVSNLQSITSQHHFAFRRARQLLSMWAQIMAAISDGQSLSRLTTELYGKCDLEHYARMLRRDLSYARDMQAYADLCRQRNAPCTNEPTLELRLRGCLRRFDNLAAAVFGTYELLEIILLYTWPRTMVALQRVSKAFKVIVSTSLSIRRALFLEPPRQVCAPAANRLFFNPHKLQLGPWKLTRYGPRKLLAPIGFELVLDYELLDDFCSRAKPLNEEDAVPRSESWRTMLLSQPLRERVTVRLYPKAMRYVIKRVIYERGDITMGVVQEALQYMYVCTVASEDWRDYVDHRMAFKKNVDAEDVRL